VCVGTFQELEREISPPFSANRKLCRTMNDDALNLATTAADLPRARDEVFDVHQSSTRRLACRLFITVTRINPASCAP
jgi:hypothetical protein